MSNSAITRNGGKEENHALGDRKEFHFEHIKLKLSMGHSRVLDIKIRDSGKR